MTYRRLKPYCEALAEYVQVHGKEPSCDYFGWHRHVRHKQWWTEAVLKARKGPNSQPHGHRMSVGADMTCPPLRKYLKK